MSARTLCHYTIATGDTRRSPRAEVGDAVMPVVRPWLAPGTHRLPPAFPGYVVTTRRLASGALEAVVRGRAELVRVVVAVTPAELAAEWTRLGLQAGADLWAPACLVELLPGLLADAAAVPWLGDLERCLAWAEVESRRGPSGGV